MIKHCYSLKFPSLSATKQKNVYTLGIGIIPLIRIQSVSDVMYTYRVDCRPTTNVQGECTIMHFFEAAHATQEFLIKYVVTPQIKIVYQFSLYYIVIIIIHTYT